MENKQELLRFMQEFVEGMDSSIASLQESRDMYKRCIDSLVNNGEGTEDLAYIEKEYQIYCENVEEMLESYLQESYH